MSYSKNYKTNNSISMFCNVCRDAGKPETEYRSHFIRESRDPNSKVVCPTLLELECRFCHKNGHTVKYCPSLKEREKQQQQQQKQQKKRIYIMDEKMPEVRKTTHNNVFACLDSDEEVFEEQIKVKIVDEAFPVLCQPAANPAPRIQNGYAAALAKPKQEQEQDNVKLPAITRREALREAPRVAPWALKTTKRSWADDTDSETEDN